MRAVAQGIPLCRGLLGKGLQIRHGKGKVSQIEADLHRAAGLKLAELNLLVTLGSFEENELGATVAFAASGFLEPQDITVEADRFFEIVNAVTGVEKFGDHILRMILKLGLLKRKTRKDILRITGTSLSPAEIFLTLGAEMSFLQSVYAKLRRHPKRIVFPDGNDPRVIRAARLFHDRGLGVAVLIGKRAEIAEVAAANKVSLDHVAIVDPEISSELPRFLKLAGKLERYRGMSEGDLKNSLCVPNYFAAMMLQNGLVDGLVGGVGAYSGSLFRPLIQLIKPLPHATVVSSAMIVEVPRHEFGDEGVLFFADCGVVPEPTVPQLASIGVQTGLLARQVFGHRPRIAFLSFSTHGSSSHPAVSKMAAAAVQARQLALQISGNSLYDLMEIDGELQADTAIVPAIARIKEANRPSSMVAGRANVLIFPDLNSGNIAAKLVHHLSGAKMYGQIILGLARPAAELSRGTLSEDIVSVAAIIGLQAVEYRKLYPLADETPAAKK